MIHLCAGLVVRFAGIPSRWWYDMCIVMLAFIMGTVSS